MPLRCVDSTSGHHIQSFDLSGDEWKALVLENKKARHLRLPCCDAQVVLKRSRRGKQFFAHKARGTCSTGPESEAHLFLKELVVKAAREHGWGAETEVSGLAPSGERWQADVLACKGKAKVAIEIQLARQTNDETLRRQERYRQSGIRGLWILKQPGFPITHDLPAVCIGGSLGEGLHALIPYHTHMSARDRRDPKLWQQSMPIDKFLDAAFDGRFQFGVPLNFKATVSVQSGMIRCWRDRCRADTRIITCIEIAFGPHRCYFDIQRLGAYPDLLATVIKKLTPDPLIGKIKRRYSKTVGDSYLSNGCHRCDALVGAFFEHEAWYNESKTLAAFPIMISPDWKAAIEAHGGLGWGVYHPADRSR